MQCLICETDTHSFHDGAQGVDYFHCPRCQLIFKSLEHHTDFSVQKERYDLHENSPDDPGYRAYFQHFLDTVLPWVGSPKSALDYGCGATSLLSDMMRDQGMVCDHYDPIYHPDESFRNRQYGLIVSVEVFEHLYDPKETFGMLLSLLRDGGHLAIRTEFHHNSIEDFLNWYYRMDPTHVVFFSPTTFTYLCDSLGCSCKENGKNIAVIQK